MTTLAVLGVTLVCYAVAVSVYGDRSVRRLLAAELARPGVVDDGPVTHHTPRGGAM